MNEIQKMIRNLKRRYYTKIDKYDLDKTIQKV